MSSNTGPTSTSGATASVQKRAGIPSQLANLQTQLKETTQACVENFMELVKLSDVNNQKSFLSSLAVVQQEHLEIQARTLAIVRACEKMSDITAQLKTILVVNDFSQINRSLDGISKETENQMKIFRNQHQTSDDVIIKIINTGSNIMRDLLERRFQSLEKASKPELVMASFCDYDGIKYNLSNPGNPVDKNKVLIGIDLSGFKVLLERADAKVMEHLASYSYAPFIQKEAPAGETKNDLNLLLDFESEHIKVATASKLINDIAEIKYHVFAAYLLPCFKQVFEEKPKPPSPQLIQIRSDEAIYVRPLSDQVELTYRTKFDEDDDFEIGKVFIQEFSETRVPGPGIRAFIGKAPIEVADVFSNFDNSRAAYVVLSLRQQVISGQAKQMNAIKLCLSFRNYLHYHLKCSKAYVHSRMRAQTSHFIKVLNRALPTEEKVEKKTMGGRSFVPPS